MNMSFAKRARRRFVAIGAAVLFASAPFIASAGVNTLTATGIAAGTAVAGYVLGASGLTSGVNLSSINGAVSTADAMCNPVITQCTVCGTIPDPKNPSGPCIPGAQSQNMLGCSCFQTVNNSTQYGICDAANHCKGISYTGLNGQTQGISGNSLSTLGSVVGSLLSSLLSNSSSGSGSSSSGSGTTASTNSTGCTSYTPTSDASLAASNSCYYYSASTVSGTTDTTNTSSSCTLAETIAGTCSGSSSSSGTSGGTTGSSGGDNSSSNSSSNTNSNTSSNTNDTENTSSTTTDTTSGTSTTNSTVTGTYVQSTGTSTSQSPQYTQGNTSGSIDTTGSGATFEANTENSDTNTGVAGFLGIDTLGSAVSDVVAGWCSSRPWASNFLGTIFTSGFFDGLCSWAGYQVGTSATSANTNANTSSATQSTVVSTQTSSSVHVTSPNVIVASTTLYGTPRVDIWAVPPSVPVGSRTTIMWNTENVKSCTESSPDGSFHETSISGGASTVPLTEATTYSISCIAYDGSPATNYVTVNIGN